MKVKVARNILARMDPEAELYFETGNGEKKVRHHARDIYVPKLIGKAKSGKVVITNRE